MSKCAFQSCDEPAVWQRRSDVRQSGPEFMCQSHFENYTSKRRIPGIDPPAGASDFWRPSIIEMVRQCDMEIRRQQETERQSEQATPQRRRVNPDKRALDEFIRRSRREWGLNPEESP